MPGVGGKISTIDGLFLESGSGGIAITAKFEKKMLFLEIERIGTANRQPTMGLDELPCLGLQSHSRHAHATLFARSWPVCRDGGIGRRSGLKIRRGQPLASSSLAPGTKLNQGFVKMAQRRSQTLFCVFLPFIPLLSRGGDICVIPTRLKVLWSVLLILIFY